MCNFIHNRAHETYILFAVSICEFVGFSIFFFLVFFSLFHFCCSRAHSPCDALILQQNQQRKKKRNARESFNSMRCSCAKLSQKKKYNNNIHLDALNGDQSEQTSASLLMMFYEIHFHKFNLTLKHGRNNRHKWRILNAFQQLKLK